MKRLSVMLYTAVFIAAIGSSLAFKTKPAPKKPYQTVYNMTSCFAITGVSCNRFYNWNPVCYVSFWGTMQQAFDHSSENYCDIILFKDHH